MLDFFRNILENIDSVLAALIATLAMSTLLLTIRQNIGVSSSSERLQESDTDRLIDLRKRIEREKDEEIAEKLRAEARQFEERLVRTRRSSLWSDDGSLEVDWRQVLAVTRERLVLESERLQARSRANLSIAIITNVIGLGFLIMVLFFFPPKFQSEDTFSIFVEYIPRITFILILQVVSAFFFRMYVSNEADLKQNKNEITNIEVRLAAGLMLEDDQEGLRDLSKVLAVEERNFLLKKGERVAGEATKGELEGIKKLVEDILKKINPSG